MFRLLNKIGRRKSGFRDPDVDVTHLVPPRKVCCFRCVWLACARVRPPLPSLAGSVTGPYSVSFCGVSARAVGTS